MRNKSEETENMNRMKKALDKFNQEYYKAEAVFENMVGRELSETEENALWKSFLRIKLGLTPEVGAGTPLHTKLYNCGTRD